MPSARRLGPTYRLQLTPSFGFEAAIGVLPHLRRLGVEYAYLSPAFEARPGSEHGYDVIDPREIRRELGGRAGFLALAEEAHRLGLKILLDIVPNHLSTYPGGALFRDVLREGRASEHSRLFDIDWEANEDRLILPLLGAPLSEVLAAGEFSMADSPEGPLLCYYDRRLPLRPDGPQSGPLEEVLSAQHYELVHWRAERRNYRRFFTIDDLIGVRVEDPAVFALTHGLLADLVEQEMVDAVRVDHVDGLADPRAYLERLAALLKGRPIVVEKILTGDEPLRSSWPVSGTTGYEVADEIRAVLADEEGLEALGDAAAIEGERPLELVVHQAKEQVVESSFSSEVARVARLLGLSRAEVVRAVVGMPVYRTYVSGQGSEPLDRYLLAEAGGERLAGLADPRGPEELEGVTRFQQLTSAAMAKGVEDTAWYRLAGRLAFLEVGGDPAALEGESGLERLLRRSSDRVSHGHEGLVPGTTHDTKRSADVRARLLALTGFAPQFEQGLAGLAAAAPFAAQSSPEEPAPGPLERRRIAETCLAMAPFGNASDEEFASVTERVVAALEKGAREAKVRDSWDEVNESYEEALGATARFLLDNRGEQLRGLFPFLSELQRDGAVLSLAQVVLRSVLPGVPDCYQGEEAWKFTLVDPDNRLPVDFVGLGSLLSSLAERPEKESSAELAATYPDGRIKMAVTRACLLARRRSPAAFSPTSPLEALALERSELADSVLALARGGSERVIAVVTRAPRRLSHRVGLTAGPEAFGEASIPLPPGRYEDLLSGVSHDVTAGGLELSRCLGLLPVALLLPAG